MKDKMKIIVTTRYINDYGNWQKFCEITGYDYYSPADDHEIILTFEQAVNLRLITFERIESPKSY